MAPVIGDYVNLVFQEDPYPGIHEWLTNHDAAQNNMMYMKIEKDAFVGLKETADDLPFEFIISPNPANSITFLNLKLGQGIFQ
jgi:hypothetical protein